MLIFSVALLAEPAVDHLEGPVQLVAPHRGEQLPPLGTAAREERLDGGSRRRQALEQLQQGWAAVPGRPLAQQPVREPRDDHRVQRRDERRQRQHPGAHRGEEQHVGDHVERAGGDGEREEAPIGGHGGPTGQAVAGWSPRHQFFLDRGWAVLGGGGTGFDPTGADGRIDPLVAGLRLASLALVVPLMEELFWRSFLMRWFDAPAFAFADPRRTSARAFILVAALFALEHDLWLAGLFAGIVYNWLHVRTGGLWIPVVSHAVTNGALGIWVLGTRSWHLW